MKQDDRFVFAGPIEQHGFGAFIEGVDAHHTLDDLPHGPIYLEADLGTYEALMRDSGFEEFEVDIRQLTLHLDSGAVADTGPDRRDDTREGSALRDHAGIRVSRSRGCRDRGEGLRRGSP